MGLSVAEVQRKIVFHGLYWIIIIFVVVVVIINKRFMSFFCYFFKKREEKNFLKKKQNEEEQKDFRVHDRVQSVFDKQKRKEGKRDSLCCKRRGKFVGIIIVVIVVVVMKNSLC